MTTQHTPGPWRIGDAGHSVFGPPNGNPSPILIADTLTRADARLIAAAPDMLLNLRALIEWMRTHTSPLDDNSPHIMLIDACALLDRIDGAS